MSVQQPQDSPHLFFRIFSGLFVMVHDAQGGEHPGAGWRNDITVSKAHPLHHLSCCLWSTSPQVLIAYIIGDGIALKHTESIITLKCWNLASRKLSEKFRGAVGLAKVEVGWCGEHADLSPTVLSSNEGLEGSPVFRICVQGPSRHGDSAEKGGGAPSLLLRENPEFLSHVKNP